MKFGVVTFPGSNCDQDIIYVLEEILNQSVERLWHKEETLKGVDFVILPGGFSYGDYLRSGAIAKHSPIMRSVIGHAKNGGYVLGICNGFQILTESGLLDGALLHNDNQKFICKNIYLKPVSNDTLLTKTLNPKKAYKIPIAHGEGRFFASEEKINKLKKNEQILFQYCDENGEAGTGSNPNGSIDNIAGICNQSKNVFGMMPHPERASDSELANTDGTEIFKSILNSLK